MKYGANTTPVVESEILDRIIQALSELQYGTVQITVQDAKVVQIEKTEKFRIASKARSDHR